MFPKPCRCCGSDRTSIKPQINILPQKQSQCFLNTLKVSFCVYNTHHSDRDPVWSSGKWRKCEFLSCSKSGCFGSRIPLEHRYVALLLGPCQISGAWSWHRIQRLHKPTASPLQACRNLVKFRGNSSAHPWLQRYLLSPFITSRLRSGKTTAATRPSGWRNSITVCGEGQTKQEKG